MSNGSLAAARSIATINVATPLLVPSFSSRGMPSLNAVLAEVRASLPLACLVSAFDVARGHLTVALGEMADVVFVDSGVFEVQSGGGDLDLPWVPPAVVPWTRSDFHHCVAGLRAETNIVLVNYDTVGSLEVQRGAAAEDFALLPHAASDFLVKPDSPTNPYIPMDAYARQVALLDGCALVGITESELGPSLLARCQTLVHLRRTMAATGRNLPIHVFGCIRPLSCLAYFLCGADVFDGLAWIRYDLTSGAAQHAAESGWTETSWARDDAHLRANLWRKNLVFLDNLARAMSQYCRARDTAIFRPLLVHTDDVLALARAAGADV